MCSRLRLHWGYKEINDFCFKFHVPQLLFQQSLEHPAAIQACNGREDPEGLQCAEWQICVEPSPTADTHEEQKGDVKWICNLDTLVELYKEIIFNYLQKAGENLPQFTFG